MSERRYKLGETKMRAPAILKAGLLATLSCARTEKGPKGEGGGGKLCKRRHLAMRHYHRGEEGGGRTGEGG